MFLCHTDKIIGIPGIRTHVVEKKKDNGRKLYSPFESKVTKRAITGMYVVRMCIICTSIYLSKHDV